MKIGFLFAGQGAQQVGMGKDLYEAYPAARALYDRADAAVPGLKRVSFEGPDEELRRTDMSQPAIVVCSLAALAALEAELGGKLPGVAVAAGLSLGEYSALCFAGALSLEDTLRLVIARGKLMQQCCDAQPSGMTSLLGIAAADVGPALEVGRALGPVGVANDNGPQQIVLSGAKAALDAAVEKAKTIGARRAMPLNVAGAYHSELMRPAGDAFRAELEAAALQAPRVPVISNVTATPHSADAKAVRDLLREQVSATVRWRESMAHMLGMGVDRFFEFGPGGVLKGMVKQNMKAQSGRVPKASESGGAARAACLSVCKVDEVQAAARDLGAGVAR